VTFSQALQSIRKFAFYYCINFSQIVLPISLVDIGSSAFSNCENVKSIDVPAFVYSVSGVFDSCYSLTSINIKNTCENISTCTTYNGPFTNCNLEEIIIPESVTEIKKSSFENMKNLKRIIIPNNVVSIGTHAFLNCFHLSTIKLGNTVESIGGYCFKNCVSLINIEISESVIKIGNGAFKNCENLIAVTFGRQIPKCEIDIFDKCKMLKEFYVNGKEATKVSLPVTYKIAHNLTKNGVCCDTIFFTRKDVKKHLEIVFENGKKVGKIPNNVVGLCDNCFRKYKEVQTIFVPKNVRSVGRFCFYNSVGEENIIFEDKNVVIITKDKFLF
ncbi:hypothetical protein EIN_353460, partial [Entamoeba invadens IP1]